MRISAWAEYALICTVHLARRRDEGPIAGREVAAREQLPGDFVEQVLLRLRRASIVRSTRGPRGGYVLDRAPEEISVRQIVRASELATFELHCHSHPVDSARCAESGACSIRPVWQLLQHRIDDALESVRLSDLLHDEPVVRERIGLASRAHGLPVLAV